LITVEAIEKSRPFPQGLAKEQVLKSTKQHTLRMKCSSS